MSRLKPLFVFFAALVWFALFQPWNGFADPDAFYHAKMASLIAAHGPVRIFPWLDLTTLGTHFADQHFLFHVLLIPFEQLFGVLRGTQVAGVFFAAVFLALFSLCLRWMRVAFPLLATFLAAASSGLIVRLSLDKASPLALAWFVLGLTAQANGWWWVAALAGFGFALTHGGFIILIVSQVLFLAGALLHDRAVLGKTGREAFSHLPWKPLAASCLGVIVGIVVHPNFPQNISFLWVQVVKIGLLTPHGQVVLGQEWAPVSAPELLLGLIPLVLAGLATVTALLFARSSKQLDTRMSRLAISFGIVVASLFALTLKSRRMVEYLVPILTLWLAILWTFVDAEKAYAFLASMWKRNRGRFFLVATLLIAVFAKEWIETRASLAAHALPFDGYEVATRALSAAKPGDRVFHSDWDEFPQLFFGDDRLRYVSGLDPTFLLDASSTLSDAYRDLTLGRTTSTAYETIHDTFKASFVFIGLAGHEALDQAVKADPRFVELERDGKTAVYRVQ